MKKIIAIALTLMLLCGATTAFATGLVTPSKTTEDLTTFEVVVENPVSGKATTMKPADNQDVAEAELEKAQAAKTVEAYFGDEVTKAIKDILGDNATISMDEFLAVRAEGYEDAMGKITIIAKFPTPYATGEKVAVNIGMFDANNVLAWTVYEGTGLEDGRVQFSVEPEVYKAIQEGDALLAVCSK